jgi:hypothetical protein
MIVLAKLEVELYLPSMVCICPWPEGFGLEGGGVLLEVGQGQECWKQRSS